MVEKGLKALFVNLISTQVCLQCESVTEIRIAIGLVFIEALKS